MVGFFFKARKNLKPGINYILFLLYLAGWAPSNSKIHILSQGANNSDKAIGGPFTRIDPENKSCIDLVIISKNLENYLVELKIDKERNFTHRRPTKKLIFTDHFRK